MAYKVTYKQGARRDLEAIRRYTEGRWGEKQAREYITDLKRACDSLSELPKRHEEIEDGTGIRKFTHQEHIIIYRIINDVVEIGLIPHGESNYGALLNLIN